MRQLFSAFAALAALTTASAALAGPGCGGASHDVTASVETWPAPEASAPATLLAEAPDGVAGHPSPWAEVLAYLDATAPLGAQATPETSLR